MTSQGSKIDVKLQNSLILSESNEKDGILTITVQLNTEREGKYASPKFVFQPYLKPSVRGTDGASNWNSLKDTLPQLYATYSDYFRSFQFTKITTEEAMIDESTQKDAVVTWVKQLHPAMLELRESTLAVPDSIRVTLGDERSIQSSMASSAEAGAVFAAPTKTEDEPEPSDPEQPGFVMYG